MSESYRDFGDSEKIEMMFHNCIHFSEFRQIGSGSFSFIHVCLFAEEKI